jgi:hypothetical protein
MGIYKNGKSVVGIYYTGIPITEVYVGKHKVWAGKDTLIILSCYYNGHWIDEYPWTDDTPWTD